MFGDVRATGVNPSNGSIYAANYDDGRVQAFDAAGKFITQQVIPKKKTDPYFDDMAVGRDGNHNYRLPLPMAWPSTTRANCTSLPESILSKNSV